MNILYIGPYREDTEQGYISRQYLEDIIQNHDVTCRPIFTANGIGKIQENIKDAEKRLQNNYDCCIQHAPLHMLTYSGYFNQLVAIPILPMSIKINSLSNIDTLNRFNKIIINNDKEESLLIRSGIKSEIKNIDCPVDTKVAETVDKKFNFGLHNDNHKFYFIGNYKKDMEAIHKILLAFYVSFRCDITHSLIMLLEGDQQDKEHLQKTSIDIKNQLNIISYKNPLNELYIFEPMSEYDKLVLHNSCDIFLNLQYGGSKVQKHYALFFGNSIIDHENTDTVDIPYGNNPSGYATEDAVESITTSSIINRMRNCTKEQNTKTQNLKSYTKKLSQFI
jgi:hypothetical protein